MNKAKSTAAQPPKKPVGLVKNKPRNMTSTLHIRIEPEQLDELRLEAQRIDRDFSDYIRSGLRWLVRYTQDRYDKGGLVRSASQDAGS